MLASWICGLSSKLRRLRFINKILDTWQFIKAWNLRKLLFCLKWDNVISIWSMSNCNHHRRISWKISVSFEDHCTDWLRWWKLYERDAANHLGPTARRTQLPHQSSVGPLCKALESFADAVAEGFEAETKTQIRNMSSRSLRWDEKEKRSHFSLFWW